MDLSVAVENNVEEHQEVVDNKNKEVLISMDRDNSTFDLTLEIQDFLDDKPQHQC